jgi:RHS repeat-associated protein
MSNSSTFSAGWKKNFGFKCLNIFMILVMLIQSFALAAPVQAKAVKTQPIAISLKSDQQETMKPKSSFVPQRFYQKQPKVIYANLFGSIQQDPAPERHILHYKALTNPISVSWSTSWPYSTKYIPISPKQNEWIVGVVISQPYAYPVSGTQSFQFGEYGGSTDLFNFVTLGQNKKAHIVDPRAGGPWPSTIRNQFTSSELANAGTYLVQDYGGILSYTYEYNSKYPLQNSWASGLKLRYVNSGMMFTPPNATIHGYIYLKEELPKESIYSSICKGKECEINSIKDSVEIDGNSVNVYTGGFDIAGPEISTQTLAGELDFGPSYTSLTANTTNQLGYGWTHNLDTKLIFPTDSGGEPGVVKFKAHSANLFRFNIKQDGTFGATEGVLAALTMSDGPPVTYTLVDVGQNTYHFNAAGKLVDITDNKGQQKNYVYDASNRLERVEGPGGTRSLNFTYDASNRIQSVTDHSARSMAFAYDADGDLVSITDVLGQEWNYIYDSSHRMLQEINPDESNIFINDYDAQNRVTHQYDGLGNLVAEFIYGENMTEVFDRSDDSKTYHFDPRTGAVNEIEDEVGTSVTKTYAENFRPLSISTEGGGTTQLTWSANGGNLLSSLDAEGGQVNFSYDAANNLTSMVDAKGYLTTFTYQDNLPVSITDALDNTTTYTYTAEGLVETETDALGHTTTYAYDQYGQLISSTNDLGLSTTYGYDELGRRITTTDPLGRVTWNEYDAAGRLTRVIRNFDATRPQNDENQYNIVSEYDYDSAGNLLSTTDTLGFITAYAYDSANQLISTTDPQNNTALNSYNNHGLLATTTDVLGRVTTYTYDDAGRLIHTTGPLNSGSSTTYKTAGYIATTTDALGRTTFFGYDDVGRLISTTQPNGSVLSREYDANGNVTASTDALGKVTTYVNDALGRLIKETDPLGGETEHFYDDVGNLIQTIDPRGNATTYAYDELNRQISITDALGYVTSYEYDDLGRRTAMVNAEGRRTEYAYDALDRLISTTDPEGHITSSAYDALGRVLSRTNAEGQTTTYGYDAMGRVIQQVDPIGNSTTYAYDAVGNLLTTTDSLGNQTHTTYDDLNRAVQVSDPLGNATTTAYNALSQVISITDANDHSTAFAYDEMGRQTGSTDPMGHTTGNVYDAGGRLVEKVDANNVRTKYEYDDLGRLTAVVENYVEGGNVDASTNVRTEYTYDANGNRLSILDGNGHETSFTYNPLNRMIAEVDALGNLTQYTYDGTGFRTEMIDANGQATQYAYTVGGELSNISYPDATVSFIYNNLGQRVNMTDPSGTTIWTYDNAGRVIQIEMNGASVGYEYDAVGNRTALHYPDGKSASYTYDTANRLQEVSADWQGATTTYSYDAANRLINTILPDGTQSNYTYDDAGRLISLAHQGTNRLWASYQYEYDNVGNRIRAVESMAAIAHLPFVEVTITDSLGEPVAGLQVYAFKGDVYSGISAISGEDGVARFTLPEGNYRFRADQKGYQFWSGEENHCEVLGCEKASVTVPLFGDVIVSITDSTGAALPGLPVYAFLGSKYNGVNKLTDENGQATFTLPQGSYRFRTDKNGLQYFSGIEDHCLVPEECQATSIVVPQFDSVSVEVKNTADEIEPEIQVYAFNGPTYTGAQAVSDENGVAEFLLPEGNYRFRADKNSMQFWSSYENNCAVLGCESAAVTLPLFGDVTVGVFDSNGNPDPDLKVYVFKGNTYTGHNGITNESGEVTLTLPQGDYRFRVDKHGYQYFSASENHCTVPECGSADIHVPFFAEVSVSAVYYDGVRLSGIPVYVFDGETYTGITTIIKEDVQVANIWLPEGSYRFRVDIDGIPFWSGETNHCTVGECDFVEVLIPLQGWEQVWLDVREYGETLPNMEVQVYQNGEYTGIHGNTGENRYVLLRLPPGEYSFRTLYNGEEVESDHTCTVPDCLGFVFNVNQPLIITVLDSDGNPREGVWVYVIDGENEAGFDGETDVNGLARIYPLAGNYRFRADFEDNSYWSGPQNHCSFPGCFEAMIQLSNENIFHEVTVAVFDANGDPAAEVPVQAFKGDVGTGISGTTDEFGEVFLNLLPGNYRFRAQYDGAYFWSGGENHCEIPGCDYTEIEVENQFYQEVTVTVQDANGDPVSDVPVEAIASGAGTGISGNTNENGEAILNLPVGNYRFRALYDQHSYLSGSENQCQIPGCFEAMIDLIDENINNPLIVIVDGFEYNRMPNVSVRLMQDLEETEYEGLSDENGKVWFFPQPGSYDARAEYDGLYHWSFPFFTCDFPECDQTTVYVGEHIESGHLTIKVVNTIGQMVEGVKIITELPTEYGYDYQAGKSNENGETIFSLGYGTYNIAVSIGEFDYWESVECRQSDCGMVQIEVPQFGDVLVNVVDENNTPQSGQMVLAASATVSQYNSYLVTNEYGQIIKKLPFENYLFYVEKPNGQKYYSGETYHCQVPDCDAVTITVPSQQSLDGRGIKLARFVSLNHENVRGAAPLAEPGPVEIQVNDSTGAPAAGLKVYAFNGATYTGFNSTTDDNGRAQMYLPDGSYRFRIDKFGKQYWSDAGNHCTTPDCTSVSATVPVFGLVTTTVTDTTGAAAAGLAVYAFNGTTYTGMRGTTDAQGQAVFNLPEGDYRFRADKNALQYWSGAANHCSVPECTETAISVPVFGVVTVAVHTGGGAPEAGLKVYAFKGTTYTGFNGTTDESGQVSFNLPEGTYRFRADKNGQQYWSGAENHCTVAGCASAEVVIPVFGQVSVHAATSAGAPQAGVNVYVFNEAVYTGFSAVTNENGDAAFTLPEGNYRFRADKNSVQYWSGPANHCAVPGCASAAVTVPVFGDVAITVTDTGGTPQPDLPVYVFNGAVYTGFNAVTDAQGLASLTLPEGDYRFRVDKNNLQYWSGTANTCAVPTCASATLTVPVFQSVSVAVKDSTGVVQPALPVYVFNAGNYTGFNAVTDAQGQAVFNLPVNSYRFRADVHGHQYWSGEEGHCALPACTSAEVAVPRFGQVIVSVEYRNGEKLAGLPVYAFDGLTYSGISGVSDETGLVTLWLPEGGYHFRADQYGLPFWSGSSNHCEVPGCQEAIISTYAYGNDARQEQEIVYTYDALNRLTAADYLPETYMHYTYDGVGNRLSQAVATQGEAVTTAYAYDDANRLVQAGAQAYTWDNNGNLLDDGQRQYSYDAANRLTALTDSELAYTYAYNGLGDRLSQSSNGETVNYRLDLNAGLTQVLSDGVNTYLYGNGRIAQDSGEAVSYFLPDGLGSVRTVLGGEEIALVRDYMPYGEVLASAGSGVSSYGFAGEWTDSSGMQYLRARYYDSSVGRFISRDSWDGIISIPLSNNRWVYGYGNPVTYIDPSGNNPAAILPMVLQSFVGLGAGIAVGAAAGATYGACTYEWALAGECGCDIQQKALSMTKNEWIGAHAISGSLIGGYTATFLSVPGGPLILSIGGIIFSIADIIPAINEIKQVGVTPCTVLRVMLDIATFAASTVVLTNIVRGYNNNGVIINRPQQFKSIPPPINRQGLRNAMGNPPENFVNPQAHHNLPWTFRDWFAGNGRGLNVNDPAFSRWVEGTPPGRHQTWSNIYEQEWARFVSNNSNATRADVLNFLDKLLMSGRFPSK